MRALVLSAATFFAARAQAPWPQPDGSASHSHAIPVAWPRDATILEQLNTVPLCSPVLIGVNGTLYAAGSDGLLHAFTPSGSELWAVAIGENICARQIALNDEGSVLFSFLPGVYPYVDYESSFLTLTFTLEGIPHISSIAVNGYVLEAVVSGPGIVVLVGQPWDLGLGRFAGFTLYSYSSRGQINWSANVASGSLFPLAYSGGSIITWGPKVFFLVFFQDNAVISHQILEVLSLATGVVIWQQAPTQFQPLLVPSASILIACDSLGNLYAVDASTGATLWSHPAPYPYHFAASAAGDFLANFSVRTETATGSMSQLPIPAACSGAVFLDTSGVLFCVQSSPPGTLIFSFDTVTGAELLSVEVPFGLGSVAFSASGQPFLSSSFGLYTLLAPSPSPSCTPSPSPSASRSPTASLSPSPTASYSPTASTSPAPPPLPAAAPSPALPALGWSALGACAGVAAALGAVAAAPRLRAWLAPPKPQPPAPSAGGPTFAAGDYALLN